MAKVTQDQNDDWLVVEQKEEENKEFGKIKGITRLLPRTGEVSQIVILTTSPYVVHEHFNQVTNKSSVCTMQTEGSCRECGPNAKPSFKGYFMILNRKFKEREKKGNDWVDKIDPKTKKPIIGPRLQVFGRGTRDLTLLNDLRKQFGRIDGIVLEVRKSGEGQSSTISFQVVERNGDDVKLATLTPDEKKLIAGRSAAELKELVGTFLRLNKPDMADPAAPADKPVGEAVDWNDSEGAEIQ
jgi:hypothetical protein